MKRKLFLILAIVNIFTLAGSSQKVVKQLSLEQVISIAQENSVEALLAKHRFTSAYWSFRSYKASYLPSVSLNADLVDFNRSIVKNNVLVDGVWVEQYAPTNRLNSSMGIQVQQNVPLTGGRIFVNSEIGRLDLLNDDPATLMSTPISVGFRQPLFSVNEFKWERQIEPLKYEEAKKQYLLSMEDVNLRAVSLFYDMALSQMNVHTNELNVANNDTLYQIAKGRFELGMIDQGDLMQMELNFLNSTDNLTKNKLDLQVKKARLRTFLGYNDNIDFELVTSKDVPAFSVDVEKAMALARENNPQMLSMERQILQADQQIAVARANARFNADLVASYGLTQRADDFAGVYKDPQQSQRVTVGVSVPILDWGMRKGMLKMAESSKDVVELSVEQQMIEFDQGVYLDVMQFNLQADQLALAAKKDTISQTRYDITKQKFLIGKVDVLKLNDALTSKDAAIVNYFSALRTYWSYYYNVRKTTLFDFERNQPLIQDYDKLLN
jgi:outer membrane protein TolC